MLDAEIEGSPTKDEDQNDGINLVMHCAEFANKYGTVELIELLAAVHLAVSRPAHVRAVCDAYEATGIDVSEIPTIEFETVKMQ